MKTKLVNEKEALKMIGCSKRMLKQLVEKGLLNPTGNDSDLWYYRAELDNINQSGA